MKRLGLIAILCFILQVSFSQNSILQYLTGSTGVAGATGSNIYQDALGNIGIGNTGPSAALHITGVAGVTGATGAIMQLDYASDPLAPASQNYLIANPTGSDVDFMVGANGHVGIGSVSKSAADLFIRSRTWSGPGGDLPGPLFFGAFDMRDKALVLGVNVGSSSVASGALIIGSNFTNPYPGSRSWNPAFYIQGRNSPFSDPPPTFGVAGEGLVSIGAGTSTINTIAQLDIVKNNSVTDYLFHIGKYNEDQTAVTDLFSVDNSGYVGIGQLNAGTNLLQISNVNGLGATSLIEANYLQSDDAGPNYFVANRETTVGGTQVTDFSINNAGQVGIGTAANSVSDLLIQNHQYTYTGSICSTITDNDNRPLAGFFNIGTSSVPCGWQAIYSNSTNAAGNWTGVNPALTVYDATSLTNTPIFQVTGTGIVALNVIDAHAQFDVMQNSHTSLDYLLHVGGTGDFLNVHNDGYIGMGQYNAGASLVEVSDVAGLGSGIPLFLIDNGNAITTSPPYFIVDGSSTGVNVGIGVNPLNAAHLGLNSTLALQGVGNTALDIYASPGDADGAEPAIRFVNSDGSYMRNAIYDDHANNMLTLLPGAETGSGALKVVNIKGSLLVSENPGDLYTSGTTTNLSATYGLIVEKGILTEMAKVAVKTTADWSDYVFDKNYKLPTFSALEAYISQNKHLPDVPSAQEVVCDGGVDVAKMDAKLLQKIEELNLYVIQLEKENMKQDEVIAELLKKVKTN